MVLKLDKSKDIKEWHWSNIWPMFTTLSVLKLLISTEVIEWQLSNK